MNFRKFYLTVESAVGLPNIRAIFSTRAYVKVKIVSAADDRKKKLKFRLNPTNRNDDLNPVWYQPISCNISDSGVLYYGLTVVIKLYTTRILWKTPIGEVRMMMKDLYDDADACGGKKSVPIMQGVNETEGMLNFSYSFGDTFEIPESQLSTNLNPLRQIVFSIMVSGISHAILIAAFM